MAVASLLDVDLGRMLFLNLIVAVFAMSGGLLWVIFYVKRSRIEYDDKLEKIYAGGKKSETTSSPDGHFLLDLLPILIPILLIALGSFVKLPDTGPISKSFEFISQPVVAVMIGAFIAGLQIKGNRGGRINKLVEQAILKSAMVIMITGAGGSLGYVIRESGVQDQVIGVFSEFPFLGVLLPFLVASILSTSTGSITVALVGTASMLAPMADGLPVSREMTAALIGCGSFVVIHANASFFWLLNRLHEVSPRMLYRNYTLQCLIMGIFGLAGALLMKTIGF
jgi:GntP family gluconate:H+ symporter